MGSAGSVGAGKGKRGRTFSGDVRRVIDGVLYITHTGCQWRGLPHEFGPWTRVWSQFHRWSRNGTWARLLAALHRAVRTRLGRAAPVPSMVVMDTNLGGGASNGGKTFHDRGGPYGATKGAKRAIAVDVTGLPLAARVLPASICENTATATLLEEMASNAQSGLLELVMVDRGVSVTAASKLSAATGIEVRLVFHDGPKGRFVPLPYAWRVEVAHSQLPRSRRLARSLKTVWRRLPAGYRSPVWSPFSTLSLRHREPLRPGLNQRLRLNHACDSRHLGRID